MKNLKTSLLKQKMEIVGSVILLMIFVVPFLTFAGSRKNIYVDGSKTGTENGSESKPYHTISEALVHADDNTDVHVAKGTYKDNIEIPKGVKIFGSDADEVIIQAKDDDKVVVSMKNDTEINKITVEKGKNGVWVKEDAKVSIIDCIIKNNDSDGIKIGKGKVENKKKVSITDSQIIDNGKDGIYSQKRRLVLINNEVSGNNNDGVNIAAGSSAWIEKNGIKDNDGSGLKLVLDGSDIWTKNNSIRNNDREGIEINAFGAAGRIDINKSKIVDNKRFGIARVQRANFSSGIWNGVTVQSNTVYDLNKSGTISPVIRIY